MSVYEMSVYELSDYHIQWILSSVDILGRQINRVGRFCPSGQNLVVKTWFKPSCPKPPRWTKPDKPGQNLIVKLVNTYNTFIQVMAMFRPGFYQIMARLRPFYGQGLCKFRPCFALVMPR